MGHKYEVSIWTKKGYGDGAYHYLTMEATNSWLMMLWAMFKNRKNGCVKLEVRR
ncbi:hypothetical protein SEA_SLOOPYJOE_60 [Arthrobacter phage Sloopyjoe]|nr:hypothetical protein PBI_STAYER_60 [Arthrobacter phage Stayer]QFG09766.1 hypothetical protein PBI_SHIBA_59 [Arthrobacter phage Shiba]QFG10203.1 hypothetical protein PBI_EGAD_60 [Arthrobacter phage Egad]QFG11772.1 hypothetical protein PBI_SALK_60 [Arthrobacter phage Salk]QFG12655.1 hypothetical protein PBI_MICHELLE_60 [Arthrobacter phage Michelle]QFG14428.1 hypothetical protein PBI_STARLORD_60 [Arthrobacter phage StarLord]UVT31137.1 hypothetical protein PBI_LINDA_60 [Arthrobacter phage Lind